MPTHTKTLSKTFRTLSLGDVFGSDGDNARVTKPAAAPKRPVTLRMGKALDGFKSRQLNPILGEVYSSELQIKDVLSWPTDKRDALLRDLAINISRRGVVAVKGQQALTNDDLSELATLFGALTGMPRESSAHIHPLSQKDFNEDGSPKRRGEMITNDRDSRGARVSGRDDTPSQFASVGWHTDISFEPVPASYTLLRMNVVPDSGGDTMYASSYEAYDRLSPSMKTWLEGLTATHDGKVFREQAQRYGFDLYTDERGNPLNVGDDLIAVHPVVRTDPVTGWKTLFVNRTFTTRINELNYDESEMLLSYLFRHIAENHNLQARVAWEAGDLVMWSNVAVQHAATFDYAEGVKRSGDRSVGVGEKPFYHPGSLSRRDALALEAQQEA